MPTLLLTHPSGYLHDTMDGHPERPDRLRAIEAVLAEDRFSSLVRDEAPRGSKAHILGAHPESHYDFIESEVPETGYRMIDADTVLSPTSWEAILRSAGSGIAAVDRVMSGEVNNAFCAMRPPGHHAEHNRAMGFCFFNNIAVAACYAREKYGFGRVAIVDFDVHHGNGTQDIFWNEPDVFYGSTHQMPLYPGSGYKSETGAGNIYNVPLGAGTSGSLYMKVAEEGILKPLEEFGAEFIFISAGFDGHERDPLSNIMLVEDDFAWITRRLMEIADRTAGGRVVSMLEGGYDLHGLSQSAGAHVAALMEA